MPHSKKISSMLWELRTLVKQQVRIIYSFIDKDILLTNWFIKKINKTPKNIIKNANQSLQKYIKNGIFRK